MSVNITYLSSSRTRRGFHWFSPIVFTKPDEKYYELTEERYSREGCNDLHKHNRIHVLFYDGNELWLNQIREDGRLVDIWEPELTIGQELGTGYTSLKVIGSRDLLAYNKLTGRAKIVRICESSDYAIRNADGPLPDWEGIEIGWTHFLIYYAPLSVTFPYWSLLSYNSSDPDGISKLHCPWPTGPTFGVPDPEPWIAESMGGLKDGLMSLAYVDVEGWPLLVSHPYEDEVGNTKTRFHSPRAGAAGEGTIWETVFEMENRWPTDWCLMPLRDKANSSSLLAYHIARGILEICTVGAGYPIESWYDKYGFGPGPLSARRVFIMSCKERLTFKTIGNFLVGYRFEDGYLEVNSIDFS